MVIMVFKNINQIQIQIQKKKKKIIYLQVWPAQSTPIYFFCKFGTETETQEF